MCTLQPAISSSATIQLDPIALLIHSSTPIRITVGLLLLSGAGVWLITILKLLQLARLRSQEREFEQAADGASNAQDLYSAATFHRSAPGGRIVLALGSRAQQASSLERLRAAAERAVVTERIRASTLLSLLGSIAASSPFIGLFGTVYGIMDAFIRIGHEKSASLPVVAPAIGEALITTAIGLAAAIPAVIFYNAIDRRVSELVDEVEAAAQEWAAFFANAEEAVVPLTRQAAHATPSPGGNQGWGRSPR